MADTKDLCAAGNFHQKVREDEESIECCDGGRRGLVQINHDNEHSVSGRKQMHGRSCKRFSVSLKLKNWFLVVCLFYGRRLPIKRRQPETVLLW